MSSCLLPNNSQTLAAFRLKLGEKRRSWTCDEIRDWTQQPKLELGKLHLLVHVLVCFISFSCLCVSHQPGKLQFSCLHRRVFSSIHPWVKGDVRTKVMKFPDITVCWRNTADWVWLMTPSLNPVNIPFLEHTQLCQTRSHSICVWALTDEFQSTAARFYDLLLSSAAPEIYRLFSCERSFKSCKLWNETSSALKLCWFWLICIRCFVSLTATGPFTAAGLKRPVFMQVLSGHSNLTITPCSRVNATASSTSFYTRK